MKNDVNPLEYHYKTAIKLDYFILGVDVALLSWTAVNTDWLPNESISVWLIVAFWTLIILSIICGLIRQLYNGILFGLNYQILYSGEMANVIERSALQGGRFMNQETGEVISHDQFGEYAKPRRETEKKDTELYEKYNKRSVFFGNLAICLLVVALFTLAGVKIYTFIH